MRFLASAGALLQLGLTILAILFWVSLEFAASAICTRIRDTGWRFRGDAWLRISAIGGVLVAALAVFAGLATLGLWSIAGLWQYPDALPQWLTLNNWMAALPRIAEPLATTLAVAVLGTLIAVVLSLLSLLREDETGRRAGRGAMMLLYLPLIVPQVAFLFGLQLILILSGTVASLPALVLAHLVFIMPYVFLCLSDPWRAFDRRYEAVAAGLGKSRWSVVLRVKLPMLSRSIMIAAAVGFAVSVGLYLPTVLIGAGRLETITTEAVALASGGNRRVIGVYAFLQMVLPALGFLVATAGPALIFRRRRAMRV